MMEDKKFQEGLMFKLGQMHEGIETTKVFIEKTENHLGTLNGKVADHEKYINIQKGGALQRAKEGAKAGGIIGGVVTICILVLNKIF